MQDYKEMGDQFELRLGNREVALMVGALFLVVLLAFALGVMMGKRLYGPASGQPVAQAGSQTQQPDQPEPTGPAGTSTEPEPTATSEEYSFLSRVNEPDTPTSPTSSPSAIPGSATPSPPQPPPSAEPPTPPPPPPTTSEPPAPEPSGETWSIQAESGPRKDGAQDKVRSLKNRGLDAWMATVRDKRGVTYYRVMIGRYPSYEEAREEMAKLKKAKIIPEGAFVRGNK